MTPPASNVLPEAVLFTFDDGWASVYSGAFPVFEAAGVPATAYIVSSYIGQENRMTEAQIVEMNEAGWDIGNHTADHITLNGRTVEAQTAAMSSCADYLDGLGLTRASHHLAYPYGEYDANTPVAIAAAGMLTGRTFSSNYATVPVTSTVSTFGGFNLGTASNTDLVAAKQWLHSTTPGRIVTYIGHKVDDSAGAYAWTDDDLAALVAYVKASGARIVTISQLYDYIAAGHTWQ